MDDQELGRRLGGIRKDVEELQDDVTAIKGAVDRLERMVNAMQLADADARADAKIVAGELRVAATALANTAQAMQASELSREISDKNSSGEARSEKVLRYAFITVGVLGAIAILGEKVLPALLSAASKFGGAP